jgi:prepilin-type N-terminal cleavage/methylation domain-containing protein
MAVGKLAQTGYTLIELVIVIALSAIFLVMVLQNMASSKNSQQFVASAEKVKSLIHNAATEGESGVGDSGTLGSFLCGTRLSIHSNGDYQVWRIYDSSDASSGGTLTYQPLGPVQSIAPAPMDIDTVQSNTDPPPTSDGGWTGTTKQDLDMVFLGPIPTSPIGQAYVYLDESLEPNGGNNGPGNCSDFADKAVAHPEILTDLYLNIYSSTNHASAHLETMAFTTVTSSIRNQEQQ